MKRILALVKRIFVQLRHDKRTLALMFIAPILILSLIYFILDGSAAQLSVAVTNAPSVVEQHLSQQQIIVRQMSESRAHDALLAGKVVAVVGWENGKLRLDLDASDASKAQKIRQAVMAALGASKQAAQPIQVHYVYGYEGMSLFDNFGAVLIGFIVFFLVFMVAGIVFLQERTSGTLENCCLHRLGVGKWWRAIP